MSLSKLILGSHTLPRITLPSLFDLERARKRIQQRWSDVIPSRQIKEREDILLQIRHYIDEWDWDDVPMSLVCSGVRYAFVEPFLERKEFNSVRDFYITETRINHSSTFLTAVWYAWMESYKADSQHTIELTNALQASLPYLRSDIKLLLEQLPAVLDATNAPQQIAAFMMMKEQPYSALVDLGFQKPHSLGLMQYAHQYYVRKLAPFLSEQEYIDRLFNWLAPNKATPLMEGAAFAIAKLLDPWLRVEPGEEFSTKLAETIVGLYGDPRLSPGGMWIDLDRVYQDLILKWLTRQDIEFFLDVVSQVEDKHMWAERREFWRGLYDEGRVSNAWVAFSPAAYELAKKITHQKGKTGTLGFGEQTARGSRLQTSLLLLQIGRCIVVEGSQNYMVHIFRKGDKNAPKLFELEYDCEQIRVSPAVLCSIRHGGQIWTSRVREQLAYYS